MIHHHKNSVLLLSEQFYNIQCNKKSRFYRYEKFKAKLHTLIQITRCNVMAQPTLNRIIYYNYYYGNWLLQYLVKHFFLRIFLLFKCYRKDKILQEYVCIFIKHILQVTILCLPNFMKIVDLVIMQLAIMLDCSVFQNDKTMYQLSFFADEVYIHIKRFTVIEQINLTHTNYLHMFLN